MRPRTRGERRFRAERERRRERERRGGTAHRARRRAIAPCCDDADVFRFVGFVTRLAPV